MQLWLLLSPQIPHSSAAAVPCQCCVYHDVCIQSHKNRWSAAGTGVSGERTWQQCDVLPGEVSPGLHSNQPCQDACDDCQRRHGPKQDAPDLRSLSDEHATHPTAGYMTHITLCCLRRLSVAQPVLEIVTEARSAQF